jgi:hypothetical protein
LKVEGNRPGGDKTMNVLRYGDGDVGQILRARMVADWRLIADCGRLLQARVGLQARSRRRISRVML